MTQREALYKAWNLSMEYPKAEIHILADSGEIMPEYAWTAHKIGKVEHGLWCEYDERIITDENEMIETLEEDYGREVSEKEALRWMNEAILIHTRAG